MKLGSGKELLHYRFVEQIGEGGMGVVWKAVDTTLDREVAIKLLPQGFAEEPERLARFEQEAKLLASLNHPNIAAVYSVHEAEGLRFLAMELVEGEDLSKRLQRGPMSVEETLKIGVQVAEALEAAHDSGVIHRDLKPANIQLTTSGKIKVLDFGLAKALAPDPASGDPSLSPTITSAGTLAGMIIGTAGYMSPEQARGSAVDRRADIWAFGCVLYEMLTGRRTFDGDTISDTMASVLKDEPDWDALPSSTPAAIRRMLRRCLTRDPDRRLSHTSGMLPPLRETLDHPAEAEVAVEREIEIPSSGRWSRTLPWAVVALLLIFVAGLAWRSSTGPSAAAELLTLVAPFPDGHTLPDDQMGVMDLSPDGKTLAFVLQDVEQKLLYVRKLDDSAVNPLPGTEDAATPIFSPDGKWIAFFADDKLKKIPVDGGNPITVCASNGNNRGASWGTDDHIVFSPHYTLPLMRVAAAGGEPQPLTAIQREAGERTHRWPHAVPDEDLVLFTVGTMDSPESYDGARIDAIRPSTGERRTVLEGASMARYVESGHLVFSREGFLFAMPFDVDTLETSGSPVPLVENVMGMRNSGVVHANVARTGLLAYVEGAPRSAQYRLVWMHRDGSSETLPAPVAGYVGPRVSPDGKQIAFAVEGDSTFDIWIYEIDRETMTRLTFEGDNRNPVWSPDGRRIAFGSVRNDALMSTYVKAADGSGTEELIYSPDRHENSGQTTPYSWSPDGSRLLLEFTNENGANIVALDVDTDESRIVLETPASEQRPALSPDGRWYAHTSDESGRFEVYVRPFPEPGGKWQVSAEGGFTPRWSRDGRELFYRWRDRLFGVTVDVSDGRFRVGRPEVLLEDLPTFSVGTGDFDVAGDGRFLLVEPAGEESLPVGVTVVVNWLDELSRRVP